MKCHHDLGHLDVIFDGFAHDFVELGQGQRHCRLGLAPGGDGIEPKKRSARAFASLGLHVAGDDQRSVGRNVVLLEEPLHVVDARRLEIGVRADDGVMVGMRFGVHELGQAQLDFAVGAVLDRLAALVAHDVALQVELR